MEDFFKNQIIKSFKISLKKSIHNNITFEFERLSNQIKSIHNVICQMLIESIRTLTNVICYVLLLLQFTKNYLIEKMFNIFRSSSKFLAPTFRVRCARQASNLFEPEYLAVSFRQDYFSMQTI